MSRLLPVLVSSALLFGCAGADVKRDYDASVDFQKLKTYAWRTAAPEEGGKDPADNSLVAGRAVSAVDAALSAKGYRKVSPAQADFLAGYRYAIEKEAADDQVRTGVGLGTGYGGGFGAISLGIGSGSQVYEEQVLTIDVVDPQSGKLLWSGFTRERFNRRSDPRRAASDMNATAARILSKFPPKPKR